MHRFVLEMHSFVLKHVIMIFHSVLLETVSHSFVLETLVYILGDTGDEE